MAQKVWTGKEVEKILLIAQDVLSLNTPIFNEEGDEVEFGGLIEDPNPNPEELMVKHGTRETLVECMQKYLSPREKQILMLRYGFETEIPLTLHEIGNSMGLTRERVRQIEARAIRKLRIKLMSKDVRKEDI